MSALLTELESLPVAVLAQVTIMLLAAIAAHQFVARSPAARHAILIWVLMVSGFCPFLILAARASGVSPLKMNSSRPPSPQQARRLTAGLALAAEVGSESPERFSLAAVLQLLWLAGTVVALARLARGLQITHQIRRAAWPIDSEALDSLQHRLTAHFGRELPQILISDRIRVPMAVGCFRPAVLLPWSLTARLDRRQLLQVLIHECAHAIRRDPLMGLYQRLLAGGFWFHPLVHLANGLLDRAREELCDNGVLRAVAPIEYSRTLLAVAESLSVVPNGLLAQPLFRSAHHLDHRVEGLLNPRRCIMTQLKPWKIVTVAITFVGGGWTLACFASPAADRSSGYDLSHVVRFEVGAAQFRDGDKIAIDEIRGTSDKMTAGNIYVVKGTYRLVSAKSAELAAFVTGDGSSPEVRQMQNIPTQKTQTILVDQGDGHFTLILYLWYDGNPHVSFYPASGGNSFGGVYFGTGDSVLKHAAWMQ